MRVLVTGGAGYIGSHACLELLTTGHELVVLDNLANSKLEAVRRVKDLAGSRLTFIQGAMARGIPCWTWSKPSKLLVAALYLMKLWPADRGISPPVMPIRRWPLISWLESGAWIGGHVQEQLGVAKQ